MLQFFKNFTKLFPINNSFFNNTHNYDNPELLRYYKTEYGSDWRSALQHHKHYQSQKGLK